MSPQKTPLASTAAARRSTRNHRLILKQLPSWLTQASVERRQAFATRLKQSQTSKTTLASLLEGFKSVESFLLPTVHGQSSPLFNIVFEQQARDELALQAEIALIKGHVDASAHQMLQSLLDTRQPTR